MEALTGRLGRLSWIIGVVALLLILALPALGQDTGDPEPVEQSAITAITLATAAVKMIVDKIRKYVPRLDGELVNVLAFALGYAATFVPEVLIDPPDVWTDRLPVAVGIAGLSAVLHNLAPADETATARQARGV